ncbi:MAG: response regulator [Pseudomonadota bacterium]
MTQRRVLVIDDEKPTLEMFELFLDAYGYEVLLAENGTQGLDLFDTHTPSIVFTDIKMPGMDGIQVLDAIKARAPDTEVIIMTGHGDMDLAVEALNHEATDFINKPISRSALAAALRRAEERLGAARGPVSIAGCRLEDGICIIEILGNINAGAEQELMSVYGKAGAEESIPVLLDFKENSAINGAGIAVLIQLLSDSRKRNQTAAISGMSENFQAIFRMVGITRFAEVFTAKEEAMAYLKDKSQK